jgi:hypothetical protein
MQTSVGFIYMGLDSGMDHEKRMGLSFANN